MTEPNEEERPGSDPGAFLSSLWARGEADETLEETAEEAGRDSLDGTPVGEADAEADARRTGGRFEE
jgi:hypothetical protein